MRAYKKDHAFGLRALKIMNSELLKYPVLRDIKKLERGRVVQRARALKKKTVLLDVGCGLGEDMHAIKDEINGGIFGIDINPHAIEECVPHSKLRFLVMDAKQTAFPDSFFDVSFLTVNTLGNFDMEERFLWLSEMLRVSKCNLVSLYINTGNHEEMRIADRLEYYKALCESDDVVFDGIRFLSESAELNGRLFTIEEIEEMFKIYGIRFYEIQRLNEVLLMVRIMGQQISDSPDLSKVDLLSWDME